MGDGNKAGDPKSSNGGSSDDVGGGSGSTNPPDLGNADRLGSMESIGDGGRGGGNSHGLANGYANLHGSSESEYPHGSANGYANLHGSSEREYPHGSSKGYANLHGIGGGGGSSSGYPHGLANGYGSGGGYSHGYVNGYANLHQSGGGGSTVPFNPDYGNPYSTQLSGGASRSVHQRAPGNLSINLHNNSYGGARVRKQEAPLSNSYAAVPRFLPNGSGSGVISRPPQRPGSHELDVAALISDRLGSVTIDNGYVGRRNTAAERHRQDRRIVGNTMPATRIGVYAGNPYWRMTLEGVRGSVSRVARDLQGRQFLCRLVKEHREEAVHHLFDEVAGDIVRLMGHGVGAGFVDDMSMLWTDEQVTRVIQTLGASPPSDVMAAARNHSGSNVLQNLISRIYGRLEEIEWFVRSLASVGELNLLALIKDQAGSRVIQKCLETFSPEHNLFVVWVVMNSPLEVAYSKHGCHTMKSCIDNSIDARTRDYLVLAVCADGLGLAQNQFGNYVVQHMIRAVPGVPWAMELLHAGFRGNYLSLSRQKASSNVVQACLVFFPQALTYEIVWELLSYDKFPELIQDPFANYVLQSAVATTQGPLLRLLQNAVRPYRDALRGSMHARKLLEMLFPSRRQRFP